MLQFMEALCATHASWGNSAKHPICKQSASVPIFSQFICLLTFKKYKETHLHVKTGPFVTYSFTLS